MPVTARHLGSGSLRSLYEYTVEGRGEFPFDMLRYDQCWPKRESEDVVNMAPSHPGMRREVRRVTLVGTHSPTEGRWESFGWKVL